MSNLSERSLAEAVLRSAIAGFTESAGPRGPPPPPIKFEWRNALELCDILVHDNRDKHLGPENFILVYNCLNKPISVTIDYNPVIRRLCEKGEVGNDINALKFAIEMDEKRCERIGESSLLFPQQVSMIQIAGNMQAFVSVQVVHNGRLIPLYTTKKLFFLQALCVGLKPIDESHWDAVASLYPPVSASATDAEFV